MNIPRYTPDKATRIVDLCDRVRECYIPKPGYVIVYFDLAQAEARFAANLSCDKKFIAACAGDVHAGNAKVIFPDEAAKGWLDGKEAKEGKGKPFRDVVRDAARAVVAQGHEVIISTGRSLGAALPIMEELGIDHGYVVVSKVRGLPAGEGYDALKGEYGDLFQRGIVDAAKVTRSALQNAASIAAMVLTTETLVTDIPEKEKAGAGAGHDHGGGMDF